MPTRGRREATCPPACATGAAEGLDGPARTRRRRGTGARGGPVDGPGRACADERPLWKLLLAQRRAAALHRRDRRRAAVHHDSLAVGRLGSAQSPTGSYFTAIRQHQTVWIRFVIWSSGIGTVLAIHRARGLRYRDTRRAGGYRQDGRPARLPYRGQQRWHAILGLILRGRDRDLGVQRQCCRSTRSRPRRRADRQAARPDLATALRRAMSRWTISPP